MTTLQKKQQITSVDSLVSLLSKVGEENKLRILYYLHKEKELSVGSIQKLTAYTQSKVSRHLKNMLDSGIVQARRENQSMIYSIASEHQEFFTQLFSIEIKK